MTLKPKLYLTATAFVLASCGGGGSDNSVSQQPPANQTGSVEALVSALADGDDLQGSTSHWLCETTNSPLTVDGINQNEFRFFNDFTGRQGDTDIGADQNISWTATNANTVTITFTDTDPTTSSVMNSIVLNNDNSQFSTSIEEIVGINLAPADYTCARIDDSGNGNQPENPPAGDNEPTNDPGIVTLTLAERLISGGTAETGFSWSCTYSNSGDTNIYLFNADDTGAEFSPANSTTTGIDYVISEPNSIRATFVNTTFASLLWNQISFVDSDNFTAIDGLAFDDNVIVSCTKGAPIAPPAPEPPAPVVAQCPCQISGIKDFLSTNATPSTFVIATPLAGGLMAEIDLNGDSLIDMGVIVRQTGFRDCSFSPFSAEFGVDDPGQISLSSGQASACMSDLDDLLNLGL